MPKKLYEQVLNIPEDSNDLIELLLNKMKNFGINYKISRNSNEPKKGKIPAVDIETVEKTIASVEEEVKEKPDGVRVEYLLELYSIAVEYYSATNNSKYNVYKQKTQEIMKSESLTKMVDEEITEHLKSLENEKENNQNENNMDDNFNEDEADNKDEYDNRIKIQENLNEIQSVDYVNDDENKREEKEVLEEKKENVDDENDDNKNNNLNKDENEIKVDQLIKEEKNELNSKIEDKVEDIVNDKVEEKVDEDKVEDKIEDKVEQKVEEEQPKNEKIGKLEIIDGEEDYEGKVKIYDDDEEEEEEN